MGDKKHIVFILSDYLPCRSANGQCATKVIDILKETNKISVICARTQNGLPDFEIYNSQKIFRIEAWEHHVRNKIKYKLSNSKNKFSSLYYLIYLRLIQTRRFFNAIFSKENVIKSFVDEYVNALSKIEEPIDMIVPVCFPFESVVAALNYKEFYNNKVRVVPYLLDKFSASDTLHRTTWNKRLKMRRHLELENKMLKQCEKVIASKDWENHFSSYFKSHLNKIEFSDIPAFSRITSTVNTHYDENNINLVYTGALNHKIRSPKYTLELLSNLMTDRKDIIFHMYIRGNCNNLVNRYATSSDRQIINYGSVSVETAHSALNTANILVSIGNTDITQKPSKIYEYMASGKPIIHLYHDNRDPVVNILKEYPMACCLNQSDENFENNKQIIIKFIDKYKKGQTIKFDQLKQRFLDATPEYTAQIISNQ